MNNYKKDIKNNKINKINFFIKENNYTLKIKGTIKNNSKDATSTCTVSGSRIEATSITYSNAATTCTDVQCSIDELYEKFN